MPAAARPSSIALRAGRLALRCGQAALLLVLLAAVGLGALWLTLPDPRELATRDPATTALIEQRRAEAFRAKRPYRPRRTWVPLERISRRLVDAVVASEDAKFYDHRGFDWEALQEAARHDLARGRFARGASTISQQLVKNLYLGTEKSLLRKVREALLTVKLERALDKRRILALYLNVAEWGDGVFGVEEGARRHLGSSAAGLDAAQAALLAAMLPAPRRADLAHPSGWLRARATQLLDRLHDEHQVGDAEHRAARATLARLLGLPAPTDAQAEPPEDEAAPPSVPAPGPAVPDLAAPPADVASPPPPTGPAASPPAAEPEPGPAPAQGAGTAGQSETSPPAQPPAAPPHE